MESYPETGEITTSERPTRSEIHKEALARARDGRPVLPMHSVDEAGRCTCWKGAGCETPGKHPATSNGVYDASTNEPRVNTMFNANPRANLGMRTGGASGIAVLDQDAFTHEVEAIVGELPDTLTIETARGFHRYYVIPAGVEVRSRIIVPGLELKAEGCCVMLPPSQHPSGARYSYVEATRAGGMAQLPESLSEPVTGNSRPVEGAQTRPHSAMVTTLDGPPIHEGARNDTLYRLGCSMRARGAEHPDIESGLLKINRERCQPPLDEAEVLAVSKSAAMRPKGVAFKTPTPETVEALDAIEAAVLWGREWPGMGGRSRRDVFRTLIKEAREHGEKIPAGVRVSLSLRALALRSATSKPTVIKAIRHLREAGLIRKDDANRKDGDAGAFVLLSPRASFDHSETKGVASEESGVSGKPLRAPLTAPCLRWSAPEVLRLGKTSGAVLDILERAGGAATVQEIGASLGLKRLRDLRRRNIARLEAAGVVVTAGDTVALVPAWLDAIERERERGGEVEAEERDREKFAREQDAYRNRDNHQPEPVPERPPMRQPTDADGYLSDLEHIEADDFEVVIGGAPDPEPVEDVAVVFGDDVPELTPSEVASLEAIRRYEAARHPGAFTWDRAGAKRLFYSREGKGHWPEPAELQRIREYLDATGLSEAA